MLKKRVRRIFFLSERIACATCEFIMVRVKLVNFRRVDTKILLDSIIFLFFPLPSYGSVVQRENSMFVKNCLLEKKWKSKVIIFDGSRNYPTSVIFTVGFRKSEFQKLMICRSTINIFLFKLLKIFFLCKKN